MAKKINVRLDEKTEKWVNDIQKYYSDLTGMDITISGAIRIALAGEIQHIAEIIDEETENGRAIFL